jgi:hypothetical protein
MTERRSRRLARRRQERVLQTRIEKSIQEKRRLAFEEAFRSTNRAAGEWLQSQLASDVQRLQSRR